MSSNAPDIRVRLSPEGVQDVIAALRKLQGEGKKTQEQAAGGTRLLSDALKDLKTLLPTIGLAALVGGFIALNKAVIDNAEAVGLLQQKVGGAITELSGLQVAFRTNSSNTESMGKALQRTTDILDSVRAGSADTSSALKRFGVDAKDFAGLNTPQAFERLARAVAEFPPGAERSAAAADLFGKNLSQELLPVLDAVGTKGLQSFIDRARELGVLLDDDLVQAARAANDALGDIKLQTEGLATQFQSGFAPQVAAAMEEFSGAIQGDGFNSLRAFADFVGFVIRNTVQAFTQFGKFIGQIFAQIGVIAGAQIDVAKAIVTGKFRDVPNIVRTAINQVRDITKAAEEDLEASRERLTRPRESRPNSPTAGAGGTIANRVTAADQRVGQARLAFLKEQLEAEEKLQLQSLAFRQQQDQAAYDQGLISLTEYYSRRREITAEQARVEVQALQKQRAAELAQAQKEIADLEQRKQKLGSGDVLASGTSGPTIDEQIEERRLKLRQQTAATDAEITQRQLKATQDLTALDAQQIAAQRQLDNERRAAQNTIDELEGNRHAVFQRNLDEEIRKLRELGVQAGQSAESIEADASRLVAARTAQFNFDEVSRQAQQALQAYDRDAEEIRRNQQAGVVTQFTGEQQLLALERQRLPVLKQIAEAQLAAAQATGRPEVIQQAQQFLDSIKQIEAAYEGATNASAKFLNGTDEAIDQGIRALVTQRDEIHSLGDAWRVFGDTVQKVLSDIAAELLSQQIRKGIADLAGAFGSSGFSSFLGAAASSGVGAAEGGLIYGPGTPTSDSIPARLSRGEFVVRASRVREPGALRGLADWNAGRRGNPWRHARGFAAGGPVGAALGSNVQRARGGPVIGQLNFNVGQAPNGQLSRATQLQTAALLARTIEEGRRRNG